MFAIALEAEAAPSAAPTLLALAESIVAARYDGDDVAAEAYNAEFDALLRSRINTAHWEAAFAPAPRW